jgi:hypothetical protein
LKQCSPVCERLTVGNLLDGAEVAEETLDPGGDICATLQAGMEVDFLEHERPIRLLFGPIAVQQISVVVLEMLECPRVDNMLTVTDYILLLGHSTTTL